MGGIVGLSLIFLVIGACGFTGRGLPLTAKRRLRGFRGLVVSGLGVATGLLGCSAAWWFATPDVLEWIGAFTLGHVAGVLGTILVVGDYLWGE